MDPYMSFFLGKSCFFFNYDSLLVNDRWYTYHICTVNMAYALWINMFVDVLDTAFRLDIDMCQAHKDSIQNKLHTLNHYLVHPNNGRYIVRDKCVRCYHIQVHNVLDSCKVNWYRKHPCSLEEKKEF